MIVSLLSQSWSSLSQLVTMLGSTSLLCQQLHSQLTDTQSQLDTAHKKAQELQQLKKEVSHPSLSPSLSLSLSLFLSLSNSSRAATA